MDSARKPPLPLIIEPEENRPPTFGGPQLANAGHQQLFVYMETQLPSAERQ